MTDLILVKDREALTTTLAIAEGTQNQHKTVIQLTRKYREDLGEFGGVAFEMRPFETTGGVQQREIALLNEPQATLLMTYMRNSPIVRQFKKRLVRAFYEMRELLLMESGERRQVDVTLNHTRGITNPHGLDIKYSLDLTKLCMRPTAQGVRLLSRLTGVEMEDIASELQAGSEAGVSPLAARFVRERLVAAPGGWVAIAEVYAAYCAFCAENEARPMAVGHFGRTLHQLLPGTPRTRSSEGARPWGYEGLALLAESSTP